MICTSLTKIKYENIQLIASDLYPSTALNPLTGDFYRLDSEGNVVRRVFPDEDDFVLVYLKDERKTKRRSMKLAWEISNNKKLPTNHVVYSKNLDNSDRCAFNLGIINKINYRKLRDCIRNLEGALKLSNNPDKPHCVTLSYYQDSRKVKRQFDDVVIAKKVKSTIFIFCARFIAKYVITK